MPFTRSNHLRLVDPVGGGVRGRAGLGERCPACGRPVLGDEPGLRLRGLVFHDGCARYRRPGGAAA